ncbi:hypothetical protein F2Q69_00013085 [Brassica cretica]|uniref:Uncharacterized protein n=1 Tax=Brassica cretica TaxID=69181 RepID=A0A8S9R1Q7_BRACR|nr:hypothetical protein F2Q69_00013085 [Brassica cretica]
MHLIFSLSDKEETGTLGVNKDQEPLKEDVDVITHLISEELGKGIGTMEKHPEPNSRHYTQGVATYTASELVLFKERNYLLKECATQTHVWKPGDQSLNLRPLGEFIPCTKPHWINQILHHLNLPFLEPICFKSQRLVFYTLGCDLAICFINQKLPKAPRIFPKLSRFKQLHTFPILAQILSLRPNG